MIPQPASTTHLTAQLNVAETVTAFPGPAALVSRDGDVLHANTTAEPLLASLADGSDAGLATAVRKAADRQQSLTRRQQVADGQGTSAIDLTLMRVDTLNHGVAVLVLGRDCSVEVRLQQALADSRQLFKDLVDCSSDFAWETDRDGCFRFVSPKGALGFAARDLIGRRASELMVDAVAAHPYSPFETRSRQDDAELWLKTANDGAAYVHVASLPVTDADGRWQGARGVCRDVTEIREREQALARARQCERLTRSLIDSIRSGIDAKGMLDTGARVIGEALGASQVTIYRHLRGPDDDSLAAEYLMPGQPPILPPTCRWTSTAPDAVIDHGLVGDRRVLSAPCRYEDVRRGRLCIAWPRDDELPPDVADVISAVAGQIGIVIAKAELQDRLAQLSNTDDLTGLPNRRSFYEQVERSIAHHRRHRRIGTLLYMDLDHFKAVNDTHGHRNGDEALVAAAKLITDDPRRAGDIPGRIGGDEFAYWLEETDITGARHIAEQIHARAGQLATYSGAADMPLTLSIGIAAMDPEVPEDLEALLARADAAMYRAKRTSRGCIAVAEAPTAGAAR